ncbi:hypothetical protein JAAARDRAFT_194660 [Jaapia argillacea MUCL 33604]|uniref:Peptidase A1 domain-containing protein n=1 Tax=Jaapia argillacea MUCL 33604 TaxID=933084 RepID=A0A067Q258_9AGAM|nr:hypothetical protein JAAARDRAFT_194660 [Jaapia argillacea MUCL 33604]
MRSTYVSLMLSLVAASSAYRLPFRRDSPHSTSFDFTNVNVADVQDIYVGTIYADGQAFEVQIDTGSSDLWLDTDGVNLSGFANSGVPGSLTYGDGSVAQGPIMVGPVSFGNFTVPKQAFISAPKSNATTSGDKGLLGVGPPGLSSIWKTLGAAKSSYNGASFLDNVFMIYPSEPNFITFQLSRDPNLGVTSGGVFTIGEVGTGFEAVSKSPVLKVVEVSNNAPYWSTPMDGVVVNGKTFNGHSIFKSPIVGSGQTLTLLDTGNSLSQVPTYYANAIYGSIKGANLTDDGWQLPCSTKLNVSFVFGGVTYPVHPLDATYAGDVDDSGAPICYGAFSAVDPPAGSPVDANLGDSFLRNVYAVYDFGKWATPASTDPFIQLLSTTDPAKAWAEFDQLNDARLKAYVASQKGKSAAPDPINAAVSESTTSSGLSPELLRNSYIIIGLLGAVILLILVLAVVTMRGSKNVGYKPIPNTTRVDAFPPAQSKDYSYSDPYHDGAH